MTHDLSNLLYVLASEALVAAVIGLGWWQYKRHARPWSRTAVDEHLAELKQRGRVN